MAIHRDHIEAYPGDLEQLANDIGNLRYDALAAFLSALSEKLAVDSAADAGRGRAKLAARLRAASEQTGVAASEIERAWEICEPFMREG